ncbi:MAG TPA: hypothetical protein VFK30_04595, partial [Anaerolineae bacterium]|nr:hypothetical protein [Anaerolineae bacterium]
MADTQQPDSTASEANTPAQRDLSQPTNSEAAAPEPAPSPVEAVPEWMRDSSSTEQPEWLRRLAEYSAGADRSENQPPAGETMPAAASPDNDVPDWLSSLRASPPTEPPASSSEPPAIGQTQLAAETNWPSNLRAARSAPIDSESPAE